MIPSWVVVVKVSTIYFNCKEERIRAGQRQGLYRVLFKAKPKHWMRELIAMLPMLGPVEKES